MPVGASCAPSDACACPQCGQSHSIPIGPRVLRFSSTYFANFGDTCMKSNSPMRGRLQFSRLLLPFLEFHSNPSMLKLTSGLWLTDQRRGRIDSDEANVS